MGDFCVGVGDEDAPPGDEGLVLAGRYELQRLIGFGATALVYEGVDTRTKRPIAVKVLIPAARARVGDFFGQEGRIAARVVNPHLVHASDFGEDQERVFIVFDLLPGRPLAHMIHGALLPCPSAGLVGLGVLDALAALHCEGIVHRDVKPDNIYVSETVGNGLHATLLDVGFAAVIPPRRMTVAPEPIRAVFGTSGFIAPEVFGGHLLDPRSDLYSLGAVLYVALTGQPVPDFRMFPEIVVPSPQVFRPEIPEALAAVVLKALSDVEARFADAEEMALAITRALREPVVALVRAPASALAVVPAMPPSAPPGAAIAGVPDECELSKSSGGAAGAGGTATPTPAVRPGVVSSTASRTTDGPELVALVSPSATTLPSGVHGPQSGASRRVTWALVVASVALAGVAILRADVLETAPGDAPANAAIAGPEDAAPQPAFVRDSVVSQALPGVDEALAGAGAALRACATRSGASFAAELERGAGEDRFNTIEIVGDEETTACARRVLDSLRFEPGKARAFTEEYRP